MFHEAMSLPSTSGEDKQRGDESPLNLRRRRDKEAMSLLSTSGKRLKTVLRGFRTSSCFKDCSERL